MADRMPVRPEDWVELHNARLREHPSSRPDMTFTEMTPSLGLVFRTRDRELSREDQAVMEEVLAGVQRTHRLEVAGE